jgi:hypothetical protein
MSETRFLVKFLIFAAVFCVVWGKPSTLDIGNACIAQYLKEKNILEAEFPIPPELDAAQCRLFVPLIVAAFESALCSKLAAEENIKADCVMKTIKKENSIDLMLMQEIVVMTRGLDEEKVKEKLESSKEKLRISFEKAAKDCDSDPAYGGLFGEILEIKNESLAVLRQDYCFTKFVVESKLIDVKDIDVNPKKIATSNIDCTAMIKSNRSEREKKLMETLKKRKLSQDQIQCTMDKFQIERAFDSNLALEVIDQLDVSIEVKRTNREKIARQLENFIKSVFICAGQAANQQGNSNNAVSIMQI